MYKVFVEQCVICPRYSYLERAYETYKGGQGRPCNRPYSNQCAVRMSIALGRAGFGLESFPKRARVHDGTKCGTEGIAHVLGARELADYLRHALFHPTTFSPAKKGEGCGDAYNNVKGKKGILFFSHCFEIHTKHGVEKHDHIDLFNGEKYYNQIIHPTAGGNEMSIGSMFKSADQVRFWNLS